MKTFPLTWPEGWKRTAPNNRKEARFHSTNFSCDNENLYRTKTELTIAVGTQRILSELRAFGVREGDSIISTNLILRLDGLPRSNQMEPADPGASVYWKAPGDKITKVMAIDLYNRVADNLGAIAATLSAMRSIDRHGGAQILERAFLGFTALPEPKNWRKVLGIENGTVPIYLVRTRFKYLAMQAHPDHGGTHEAMAELNLAMEAAERELKDINL